MGDNVRHSDEGNDEHHIHLRMLSSLHFPSRCDHHDGHGSSKEEVHHHDGHGSSKEEVHHHDGHDSSTEEAHDFHKDVPKGCVAVYVGTEGEERQRFAIPAVHINHPLFQKLLKEAEKEYGFEQKGVITIPCHVSDFLYVQELINEEQHQSQSISFCFR